MIHSLETIFQPRKGGLSPGLDVYSNRIHSSTQFGRSELRRGLKRSLRIKIARPAGPLHDDWLGTAVRTAS